MVTQELESVIKRYGNTFMEKFEVWADTLNDKVFLYYGEEDRRYTYNEFNRLSNTLARNMLALGLKKGDHVSLLLFNPIVTTLSMFALWKIGAVFCPINFNYKGKLLIYQINDTKPTFLITEQKFIDDINHIKTDIPPLNLIVYQPSKSAHDFDAETATKKPDSIFDAHIFDELLQGDGSNLGVHPHYAEKASIIYTSGTTGNPKGVILPHRYLLNYLFNDMNLAHPDDVIYNDLPLYHVGGSFYNVVRAAWAGCSVAVWDKFSPREFWHRIKKCNATNAVLLDVMVPWLMAQDPRPEDRMNSLKAVNMMPLPQNHREVAKRFGFDFVSIGYGSTEAGAVFGSKIDELGDESGTWSGAKGGYSKDEFKILCNKFGVLILPGAEDVPKGFMGNPSILQEIAIWDDDGRPVSPGAPGQLAIRSKLPSMMFDGYYNKPEVTEKCFKDGWYYSSDIIVQNEKGFCFVDRIGGFIRARGENMSSHQVESVIKSHPAIGNCAVFPVEAAEGSEEDIAVFIVLKKGELLPEDELRGWMNSEMPNYMIPKHVRFVDSLPVTPTFKVEKYKLKEIISRQLGLSK